MRFFLALSTSALALLLVQCRTPQHAASLKDDEPHADQGTMAAAAAAPAGDVTSLPTLVDPSAYTTLVESALNRVTYPTAKKPLLVRRLSHYLGFLGVPLGEVRTRRVISRILESSVQFLLCDFNDWECLEKRPLVTPRKASRVETAADLGAPVAVSEPLRIQTWYSNAWDKPVESIDPSKMLAQRPAEKIREEGQDAVAVAIYGIDETERSMKPVYDALSEKIDAGVDVRAVVDTENYTKGIAYPIVYSYTKPASGRWIFDPANPKHTNIAFQYKDKLKLLNELNRAITSDDQAKGRIAWPNRGIMHNKFAVFTKGGERSVWTGTANVADTCMGTERNANVGVFIDNTAVADTFLAEFEEMYAYQPDAYQAPGKLVTPGGSEDVPVGRFHNDKRPNTKRFFRFQSGEDLRVHFAPTDDAEHRVIIPWIHSAKAGDVIRVSMFGGAGIELVRAFQYAAARGVEVRIVFDRLTGSQLTGWLRDKLGTVLDVNPYAPEPAGKITVRRSTWRKQNHHKSASLTRKTAAGMVPESVIIGSQNWSTVANNQNDENMITVRARQGALGLAQEFNEHFDGRMWLAAKDGELKYGVPYAQQTPPMPVEPEPTPGADTDEDETAVPAAAPAAP